MVRTGITPTEKPIFLFCMFGPWLLLMALAIENAAKGIIVYSMITKDPSLKEKARLEIFDIKGHGIDNYLRRAFKAKHKKLEKLELRLAEDLAAYADFAGKYEVGTKPEAHIPHDLIMRSTPVECSESYIETIIGLYKKLSDWLRADVEEAHAEEYERIREGFQELEEKWGHLLQ